MTFTVYHTSPAVGGGYRQLWMVVCMVRVRIVSLTTCPGQADCKLRQTPVFVNLSKGQVALYVAQAWGGRERGFLCSTGRHHVHTNWEGCNDVGMRVLGLHVDSTCQDAMASVNKWLAQIMPHAQSSSGLLKCWAMCMGRWRQVVILFNQASHEPELRTTVVQNVRVSTVCPGNDRHLLELSSYIVKHFKNQLGRKKTNACIKERWLRCEQTKILRSSNKLKG